MIPVIVIPVIVFPVIATLVIVIVKVIRVTCVIPVITAGNMSIMNFILTAVTAVATGATAVLTFFSLKNEKRKKRISVFAAVDDDPRYLESEDYVLSKKYNIDCETVRYLLGKDKSDKISLVDFENIVIHDQTAHNLNLSEKDRDESY